MLNYIVSLLLYLVGIDSCHGPGPSGDGEDDACAVHADFAVKSTFTAQFRHVLAVTLFELQFEKTSVCLICKVGIKTRPPR